MQSITSISIGLHHWFKWVVLRPGHILIALSALTVLAGIHIPMLTFSGSVRHLIVDDLPERARYDRFKSIFGSDELIQVVVKDRNMFHASSFGMLERLSRRLEKVPGVNRVVSLPHVKSAVDPSNQWSLDRFAALVAPVALFQRYLISDDRRVAGITLVLDDGVDHEAVTRRVADILSTLTGTLSAYQIGMPTVGTALAGYARNDILMLPFCTLCIIAVLLLVVFNRTLAMILPLVCVGAAATWTLGAMAFIGIPLNMLTVVVPILQIAVGTAYCLYIYCEFKRRADACEDAGTALSNAYSRTLPATLTAVGTTVAGTASLMVTPIGAVRQFSAFASLGVAAMLVAVMTVFPCLLVLAHPMIRSQRPYALGRLFTPQRVDRLVRLIIGRRRVVFMLLSCFAVVAVAGILRIRVETNPLSYFRDKTVISEHFHDIYHHLSGSFPLHVEVRAPDESAFLSRPFLDIIADHQRFLETLSGVDKTMALTDYLMLVNYVSNGFDPASYQLPEADYEIRMLVNQSKSILGRGALSRYVNPEFNTANITLLSRLSTARGFLDAERRIRDHCARHQQGRTTCQVTGFGLVLSLGSRHLVRGQVLSLAITLGVIFVLIYLMFLSVKIGLIAMTANLFPILVSFGVMGWVGIELSMGTCLIASIVVGLAVDDSIHYLARYRRAYLQTMDAEAAMRLTLIQVGPPIAATSLAISAGFSILMFSNFSPTAVFGMLMMLAMASALSGGVVILPALLSRVSPITMEEMFRVRTGGDDLQKTVLLLKGMSRFQIHRVFKTGTIRRVQAGDCLFDEGDVADRLYVVISGVFDAVMAGPAPSDHNRRVLRKRLNRLKVGEVIGEMGLLTSGLRCVSVYAVVSGEVLALEQSHLERIRRLYPRTASRFFANLSAILTRKLITADTCLYETCNIDDDNGLLNRGAFLDRLTTEIQKAKRFGDSMTLCLLDIDGHGTLATRDPLAAEHVLGKIAKAMLDCFRSIDVCGRFDKACLAVLLTRANATGKRSIRQRLERVFDGCFKKGQSGGTHISCCFIDLDDCVAAGQSMSAVDPARIIRKGLRDNDRHRVFPSVSIVAKTL